MYIIQRSETIKDEPIKVKSFEHTLHGTLNEQTLK